MPNKLDLTVFAPVAGTVVPIEQVPDPVFAEKMLGDGLAINPSENFIYAPFEGTVTTLHKALHAIVLKRDGIEILIHIGLETVNLHGKGFKALIEQGATVIKGQKLIEFDRDFLAKNAPSNLVITIIANDADIHPLKTTATIVKAGDAFFTIGEALPSTQNATQEPQGDCALSDIIEVQNKNGFHARPASAVAKIAHNYMSEQIYLLKQNKKANAKSMVELLGLAIEFKDKIQISACGPRKDEAIKELTIAILSGLNEGTPNADKILHATTLDLTKETVLKGIGIYPALLLGKSFLMEQPQINLKENADNIEAEFLVLDRALSKVKQHIQTDIDNCSAQISKCEILKAHLSIIDDDFLTSHAKELIAQKKTAAFAWQSAIKRSIDILNATDNKLLKERAADFTDVETRVIMEITGTKPAVPVFPAGSIVIAKEILPFQLNYLNSNVSGVVMAFGSSSSHVAIMLKNMGMPAIAAVGEGVLTIHNGTNIILNSQGDDITINPNDIGNIKTKIAQKQAQRSANKQSCKEPAITKDGVKIVVMGNVGSAQESAEAFANGAEGLGLVRTEFVFAAAPTAPTEQEQFDIYQKITAAQNGQPVTIRAFDVGGDKPLKYLPLPQEENPIMGLRGVRNYKLNLDLFKSQVRAVLRVQPYGTARIMLPMIGFIDELVTYKDMIRQIEKDLNIPKSPVGIMVEVPSAAILADEFARYADFFSIGSNDLTQYTLAVDRGNSSLSTLADSLNPAVLMLIKRTVEGAAKHNRPVGVCGAMASDIVSVAVLIGLGIRELGVVSSLIPDVKAFIRSVNISDCQKIAKIALEEAQGAAQVRQLVKDEFKL